MQSAEQALGGALQAEEGQQEEQQEEQQEGQQAEEALQAQGQEAKETQQTPPTPSSLSSPGPYTTSKETYKASTAPLPAFLQGVPDGVRRQGGGGSGRGEDALAVAAAVDAFGVAPTANALAVAPTPRPPLASRLFAWWPFGRRCLCVCVCKCVCVSVSVCVCAMANKERERESKDRESRMGMCSGEPRTTRPLSRLSQSFPIIVIFHYIFSGHQARRREATSSSSRTSQNPR